MAEEVFTVTKRLEAFIKRARRLSLDEQEHLMDEIEDVLDQEEWHALIADPRSEAVLDALLTEARRSPKHPWPTPDDAH